MRTEATATHQAMRTGVQEAGVHNFGECTMMDSKKPSTSEALKDCYSDTHTVGMLSRQVVAMLYLTYPQNRSIENV